MNSSKGPFNEPIPCMVLSAFKPAGWYTFTAPSIPGTNLECCTHGIQMHLQFISKVPFTHNRYPVYVFIEDHFFSFVEKIDEDVFGLSSFRARLT